MYTTQVLYRCSGLGSSSHPELMQATNGDRRRLLLALSLQGGREEGSARVDRFMLSQFHVD